MTTGDALLDFTGDDAGTGPLTWGQRSIWHAIAWMGDDSHYFNLDAVLPIPDGRDEDDVLLALRQVIERYQALRTLFPDYDHDPRQQVARDGRYTVARHHCSTAEVDATVDAVRQELRGRTFDHRTGWPARFAVVSAAGQPRYLVVVLSHQVMDGGAWQAWSARLVAALEGKPVDPGPQTWQPLAVAAFEASPAGQRRSQAAVRRLSRRYSALPVSLFDHPVRPPAEPRFVGLALKSRVLATAGRLAADQLDTSVSTVLLAAYASVLSRHSGHDDVAIQVIAANRAQSELRDCVAPLAQNALFTVAPAGLSLHARIRATWRGVIESLRTSHYDPAPHATMLDAVQRSRGAWLDRQAFFNDVRPADDWPTVPGTDPAGLERLSAGSTIEVFQTWDSLGLKVFLTLERAEQGAAVVLLQVDTAYVPEQAARAMLAGIEALVVRAARGDADEAAVHDIIALEPVARPGMVRHAAGWVDPSGVTELVRRLPGVADAAVFAEPGGEPDGAGRSRLVGYVVAAGAAAVTPESLHEACWTTVVAEEPTGTIAPDHYVVCAAAPDAAGDATAWRAGGVIAEGSGRPDN